MLRIFKILLFRIGLMLTLMRLGLLFNRKSIIDHELKVVKNKIERYNIRTVKEIGKYLKNKIKYKSDGFFNHQQYAFETLKIGHGDCEDIHRVGQLMVYLLTGNEKVYLAEVLTNPEKYSHAFIIIKNDNKWIGINYNYYVEKNNLQDVVNDIMFQYKINEILDVQFVDVEFRIRNRNGL